MEAGSCGPVNLILHIWQRYGHLPKRLLNRSTNVRRMERRTSLLPHEGQTSPKGRLSLLSPSSPLPPWEAGDAKSGWLILLTIVAVFQEKDLTESICIVPAYSIAAELLPQPGSQLPVAPNLYRLRSRGS